MEDWPLSSAIDDEELPAVPFNAERYPTVFQVPNAAPTVQCSPTSPKVHSGSSSTSSDAVTASIVIYDPLPSS